MWNANVIAEELLLTTICKLTNKYRVQQVPLYKRCCCYSGHLWLSVSLFVLQWTPEGRRLVTGASSGEFTLWNGLTFNFETILQVLGLFHMIPVYLDSLVSSTLCRFDIFIIAIIIICLESSFGCVLLSASGLLVWQNETDSKWIAQRCRLFCIKNRRCSIIDWWQQGLSSNRERQGGGERQGGAKHLPHFNNCYSLNSIKGSTNVSAVGVVTPCALILVRFCVKLCGHEETTTIFMGTWWLVFVCSITARSCPLFVGARLLCAVYDLEPWQQLDDDRRPQRLCQVLAEQHEQC